MADTYLPLAALLLVTAITLLLATSAVPVAAAAAADKYTGRMVIIRAPGATVVSAGGAALNKWQQRRRLVEDEVAPEFGGGQLLGADTLNYKGLDPNKQVCLKAPCPQPGEPYGRGCESKYGCTTKPPAGHARAVHV